LDAWSNSSVWWSGMSRMQAVQNMPLSSTGSDRHPWAGPPAVASRKMKPWSEPETDRLVGYLIVSRYVDAWHVMNIAVDPRSQRRGIATMMLEQLFELTSGDDRRGYTLEVRVSNQGAIKLYERLGFRGRGVRRGYYTDNREDALIMGKDPVGDRVSGVGA